MPLPTLVEDSLNGVFLNVFPLVSSKLDPSFLVLFIIILTMPAPLIVDGEALLGDAEEGDAAEDADEEDVRVG